MWFNKNKERKAVLIVHGFAGGTYDQEILANNLELEGFDVYTFTLPGHEKSFLKKVTREEWISECKYQIERLINHGYKEIYVIGHSMGGVLASYLAANYKEVKKLVLAAPAFKYLTFGEDNFELLNALKNSPKVLKDYKKEDIIPRLIQFPTSVVKEFMSLVEECQDLPSKIDIPTLIIQGSNDKIVPIISSEYVYDNLKSKDKRIILVDGVTHDIFRSKEIEHLTEEIKEFLNK